MHMQNLINISMVRELWPYSFTNWPWTSRGNNCAIVKNINFYSNQFVFFYDCFRWCHLVSGPRCPQEKVCLYLVSSFTMHYGIPPELSSWNQLQTAHHNKKCQSSGWNLWIIVPCKWQTVFTSFIAVLCIVLQTCDSTGQTMLLSISLFPVTRKQVFGNITECFCQQKCLQNKCCLI